MAHVQEMLRTNPSKPLVGGDALAACIAACYDCAQTCASCADACLGEEAVVTLRRCIRLNLDCQDACEATGRILSRQFEPNLDLVHRQLELCRLACEACADECNRHRDRHEHCGVCADACRRCEDACNGLLAAMPRAAGVH